MNTDEDDLALAEEWNRPRIELADNWSAPHSGVDAHSVLMDLLPIGDAMSITIRELVGENAALRTRLATQKAERGFSIPSEIADAVRDWKNSGKAMSFATYIQTVGDEDTISSILNGVADAALAEGDPKPGV